MNTFEFNEKMNTYSKNDAHDTMSSRNLQICVVILVINVAMSGIKSSSCFEVSVSGVNNENESNTL